MKRAVPLSAGLAAGGGVAIAATRRRRRMKAKQERAQLEADLLIALDEVEAEIARLNAEFAARL